MKGSNTIEINHATMVEAVQEYLDKRLTTSAGRQIVKGVEAKISYGGPGTGTYTVTIEGATT